MIKSELCEMLGIQYPVFQGGMAWIADGKLAAAVSDGGGLGIIAAGRWSLRSNGCILWTGISSCPIGQSSQPDE